MHEERGRIGFDVGEAKEGGQGEDKKEPE